MTHRPANKLLADEILGEPVERWLRAQRREFSLRPGVRELAQLLATATGGKVVVTHATIARWLAE